MSIKMYRVYLHTWEAYCYDDIEAHSEEDAIAKAKADYWSDKRGRIAAYLDSGMDGEDAELMQECD